MTFIRIDTLPGKLFVPDRDDGRSAKHRCPDCQACQFCSPARCAACRGGQTGREDRENHQQSNA